jgi:16S rRNA (guanine527-N7)-methyltransferase
MPVIEAPQEFYRVCARNGITLSESQKRLLNQFVEALLEWNARINLISRRDQENIWYSHVLHSLSILFYVELTPGFKVLDLGTGGGFPGIPLAIARPDIEFVLLDSIKKKTGAVQDMVGSLGLSGVSVWTGRAEDAYRNESAAGMFDVVVARAVASLRDLVRWSRPYLKAGAASRSDAADGTKSKVTASGLVALKGGDLEKEIVEAKIKEGVSSVRVIRMSFEGSTELGLEDKKAVMVSV